MSYKHLQHAVQLVVKRYFSIKWYIGVDDTGCRLGVCKRRFKHENERGTIGFGLRPIELILCPMEKWQKKTVKSMRSKESKRADLDVSSYSGLPGLKTGLNKPVSVFPEHILHNPM